MRTILQPDGPWKFRIENKGLPGRKLLTTLLYRRDDPVHFGLIGENVDDFVKPMFDSGKVLPEVLAYLESKAKGSGIDKENARSERELQKLDLDHAEAIANLEGKPLAIELSRIAERRTAINAELAQCKVGATMFAEALELKRTAAREAVGAHYMREVSGLLTEVKNRLSAAFAKLEQSAEFLAILDEIAKEQRFGERMRNLYSTATLSTEQKEKMFTKTLAAALVVEALAEPAAVKAPDGDGTEPSIAQTEGGEPITSPEADSAPPQPELDTPPTKAKGKGNTKGKVVVDVPAPTIAG